MELINQIDESFKFENKEIRIIGSYNEPYFVAKDICNVLGLSNITEALKSIPQKWKKIENLTSVSLKSDIMYQEQGRNMIILSEAAVYKLIMRSSNKPITSEKHELIIDFISLRYKIRILKKGLISFSPIDGKPKYRCITFYLYVLLDFYNSYLKIRYL